MLGAPSLAAGGGSGNGETRPVDGRAPDFELPISGGGTLRLSAFAGRVVLLSFVQDSTAARVRDPLATLEAMHERYDPRGLQVVAVDASDLVVGHRCAAYSDGDPLRVERVTVVRDDSVGSTVARFGVIQLPTTFLIGPDGRIAHRWDGQAPMADLEAAVRAALPRVEASR